MASKLQTYRNLLYIIVFSFGLYACAEKNHASDNSNPISYILVSKDTHSAFEKWLLPFAQETDSFVFTDMYSAYAADSFNYWLPKADAIIIAGGEDINPALYGRGYEIERCGKIDNLRDSIELVLIQFAYEKQIPLLAVCRGHQILNVAFGGSLIVDIPDDYGSEEMHRKDGSSTSHTVKINRSSYLHSFVNTQSAPVYSNHHQAIARLAEGFTISSYAPDDIPESIELTDRSKHPFLLGVQWHPEAMDSSNPLSGKIAEEFLKKIQEVKNARLQE